MKWRTRETSGKRRRGGARGNACRRGRRESPPEILGKVILVMSGPGRKMYQYLEPKPEGAIFSKRSKPQDAVSSPHDTGASIANWLESNIQGRNRLPVTADALRAHEPRHKPYLASRLPYCKHGSGGGGWKRDRSRLTFTAFA